MSNARVFEKSFNESWAYASALKDELKAVSYDVQPYPGTFKSGRDRWMATFLSGPQSRRPQDRNGIDELEDRRPVQSI